jgi:hypothetical protein
MSDHNNNPAAEQVQPAQIIDSFMQRTALGGFLMALAYAMSAAMLVTSSDLAEVLDKLQLGLGILVILVVFPAFLRIVKLRRRSGSDCEETDGYIVAMFKKASTNAFSLTFVFLIIMQVVTEKIQTDLPASFFVDIILAFTLGVFSITFFMLVRSDSDETEDDFDTESHS